ncbi:PocR ligand-binding domain-containing protein [Rhizomicrobium electricum]|uniref:histidine kinase n=1 Tax=Rhizomicrobium electricum TaxID=480070 RepID=A0ABN1ETL6_9PROT|nr:PocR ligand-binding domain-containing protein [Rhizomicrobium electricum]NIJ49707.1 PAS domain S-box-containing protein [Rhizomicrobium electricum]
MKFAEVIPVSELQALCESFSSLTGAVTAVLDLEGNVLVAAGWHDICTQFHRRHAATALRCRESDTALAGQLQAGERYNVYRCKNGLVDVAVPIIICGEHVGNFFTGQFFFKEPNEADFARQAEEFGFDKARYMRALGKVPVFSEAEVRLMMEFFTRLAQLIGEMGLARANKEEANRELRESRHLLQTIIDTAPIRVFWKDRNLRYLGCNPVFAADAGKCCPDEVVGQDDSQMAWADQAEAYRQDDRAVIDSGVAKLSYDEPITTSDGRTTWIRTAKVPLRNQDNEIIGVLGTYDDITARHQAEEDLRRYKDQLEETVRSRTAELMLVRDAAEAANKAKSTFLAAASHDLRQPLQASLAYLSALSRKVERKDLEDLCDKIRQPLKAMGDILEALLDISDLESGHLQPRLRDFALNDLLVRVVACAEPLARHKGLILSSLPTDLMVHSDPKMLERIVSNFLTNAIRYTDKGVIGVYCVEMGDKICLSVTDTGIGIPAGALATIFDDHVQLGNPARDRRKGLGLGLSIAKRIADTLGHRISVRSELGSGSSFSIELPQAHNAAAPVETETPPPKVAQEHPVVLLIDDDQDVADAVQMMLSSYSIETYMAHSRDAALRMLETGLNPGLVLCDYRLPDVNGIDLIRQVRKVLDTEVPAVLVTGDMGVTEIPADLAKCALLHKPVDIEAFLSVISTLTV